MRRGGVSVTAYHKGSPELLAGAGSSDLNVTVANQFLKPNFYSIWIEKMAVFWGLHQPRCGEKVANFI